MNHRNPEETLAHFTALVASSEDAIISKDLNGVIRSWNPAAERIFEYTAAQAIGSSIVILIPPERHSEEAEILGKLRRGERIDHYETVRMTRSGRRIDISLTISPIHDADGNVVGISKIAHDITDRKLTRIAREHLASIVDSSDDAIISKDLNGVIRSWNSGARSIFGYSAEEVIGRSITLLIPPARHSEEQQIIEKIRNGKRVEHYETVRVTKDGREIEVSLSISPIRDASGSVIGASKIARDITARRRLERELAAQREWFRVTLSSVGDAVIASDVSGQITFLNSVAEKLTGWSSDEATGRPLAEVFRIVNEDTREPVENPAQKVLRSGAVLGLANHTALIRRDGTECPIADSAAPIFDDDRKIIGVVLIFRDITTERLTEEFVHEQREWFEQTLQGIGDGVIATDIRGHVVFMNPVAEYLTGHKLDECRDMRCTDIFRIQNEHSRLPVENPVGRVLREGQIVGLANHTILISADGTERFIDDSGAPIRNRSGRLVGAVLVFRDISERRRLEIERSSAAYERERLLESERVARAEAERANRMKDDFVATLSHELRTPLNAILGWTQVLRFQRSRPELIETGIEVIERNTRIQAQLVGDLLDISRIISGKLTLELEDADFSSIIDAALETVQGTAQTKGVAIHTQLDRSIGSITADPARLQQIVWNLLSNAIKFTQTGGRIDIILERIGPTAQLTIQDTGIGIQPEFLPSLFGRFRQAESATNRRFGGLGLGLAIVKQLTDLHGGSVEASSKGEGRGATFCVRLPIAQHRIGREDASSGASAGQAAVQLDPGRDQDRALVGLRILVVEDDADTADLLQRFLQQHGAMVTTVSSAVTALETIAQSRPQLLISDIGMPGMDGYELIRRIRNLDPAHGSTIPAVAVTAFARSEDRARALIAGYQAYLTKPIEVNQLISTMKTLAGMILSNS